MLMLARTFAFAGALVATVAWAQAPPPPIVPTAPPGTSDNQVASTAFVQQALAAHAALGLIVGTTLIGLDTNNGVLYDNVGALGILSGTSGGVIYFNGTHTVASSNFLPLNNIVVGGGAGAPGTMAGTIGGVPYFNGTNTVAVSNALAGNGIVVGGGAGAAPNTLPPCTITRSGPLLNCQNETGTGNYPQFQFRNDANDASSGAFSAIKTRANTNTLASDVFALFNLLGFANGGQRFGVQIVGQQNGVTAGSFIPTDLQFHTSNNAGALNSYLSFNHSAHLFFSGPTLPTAVCDSGGATVTSASGDVHGTINAPSSPTTNCTLTFAAAYNNVPHCIVNNSLSAAAQMTVTTTTLKVAFGALSSVKINYRCIGS